MLIVFESIFTDIKTTLTKYAKYFKVRSKSHIWSKEYGICNSKKATAIYYK